MPDVNALRTLIDAERERFGVPGVAIAVVLDGQPLLCDGFGVRDTDTQEPVTAETHFPIASDTKAFTAALLCQLAAEGAVDLDAPIRRVLPWFELRDPHATALASVRDLLSHRTGLPRHDFIWYGQVDLTPEQIVRRLRHLEPSRSFRQTWQYNNLGYSTAGYLTELLTGQEWQAAVRDRLLAPLEMYATVFDAHAPSVKELATPYQNVQGSLRREAVPEKTCVGPAGAIVSTAQDLAQWLLARLGHRQDVLPSAALAELHGPAMIGGVQPAAFDERQPMGYALGCQVESYRGRRIIRHGGNLVGYSSDVTIVPEAGIGIAILTNLHGTPLRDALPLAILDQLLELEPAPWGERYHALLAAGMQGKADVAEHRAAHVAARPPSGPLDDFCGVFEHPAYGTFTITTDSDRLVPDFHRLGSLLELRHRDRDAWDLFLVEFDHGLPLVFQQDALGAAASLAVTLEPTVAPIVFRRRPADADPQLLKALPGAYELGPMTVTVSERGEGLVVALPGAAPLVLASAGGRRFSCPDMPAIALEAEVDDTGAVTAIMLDSAGRFTRSQGNA